MGAWTAGDRGCPPLLAEPPRKTGVRGAAGRGGGADFGFDSGCRAALGDGLGLGACVTATVYLCAAPTGLWPLNLPFPTSSDVGSIITRRWRLAVRMLPN